MDFHDEITIAVRSAERALRDAIDAALGIHLQHIAFDPDAPSRADLGIEQRRDFHAVICDGRGIHHAGLWRDEDHAADRSITGDDFHHTILARPVEAPAPPETVHFPCTGAAHAVRALEGWHVVGELPFTPLQPFGLHLLEDF